MGKIFSYSPRRAQAELKRRQRFAQAREEQAIWNQLVDEDIAKRTAENPDRPAKQGKPRNRTLQAAERYAEDT